MFFRLLIKRVFSSLVLKKEKKTFFDSDVHVYLKDYRLKLFEKMIKKRFKILMKTFINSLIRTVKINLNYNSIPI